ncbi:hypothetical protein ACWENQ_25325 [Nonomuraea sp. NPDC004354]
MLVPLLAAGSLILGGTPAAPEAAAWRVREPAVSGSPATPSLAPARAQRAAVRYAGLASCPGANGKRRVCSPWRLWLRGGKTLDLPDAQVRSLDARGREQALRAPISVDPYGRHVAYFATTNHRLVVRNVPSGKRTPVPGQAGRLPYGLRMSDVTLRLGPHGRFLVVDPVLSSIQRPPTVIEVATGKTWPLPPPARVQGFSPDGRLLRLVLDMKETAVYRPGAAVPSAGVPLTGWGALAPGGATLAAAAREGSRVSVRFHDPVRHDGPAGTTEPRTPVRVKVPAAEQPRMLTWDSSTRLTLLTFAEPRTYVARSIDLRDASARLVDRFTLSRDTWDVHLAGD